jgi:hypothetical protein
VAEIPILFGLVIASALARITIYLPDNIEHRARKAAKAKGESVSRWVADQVMRSLADTWPKAVLDAAGAIPEFPSLEEIRAGYRQDIPRESME